MPNWADRLIEEGPDEDSLEKIIETVERALLPMMKAMLPEPTTTQISLLTDEVEEIHYRLLVSMNMVLIRKVTDGDDDDTT